MSLNEKNDINEDYANQSFDSSNEPVPLSNHVSIDTAIKSLEVRLFHKQKVKIKFLLSFSIYSIFENTTLSIIRTQYHVMLIPSLKILKQIFHPILMLYILTIIKI